MGAPVSLETLPRSTWLQPPRRTLPASSSAQAHLKAASCEATAEAKSPGDHARSSCSDRASRALPLHRGRESGRARHPPSSTADRAVRVARPGSCAGVHAPRSGRRTSRCTVPTRLAGRKDRRRRCRVSERDRAGSAEGIVAKLDRIGAHGHIGLSSQSQPGCVSRPAIGQPDQRVGRVPGLARQIARRRPHGVHDLPLHGLTGGHLAGRIPQKPRGRLALALRAPDDDFHALMNAPSNIACDPVDTVAPGLRPSTHLVEAVPRRRLQPRLLGERLAAQGLEFALRAGDDPSPFADRVATPHDRRSAILRAAALRLQRLAATPRATARSIPRTSTALSEEIAPNLPPHPAPGRDRGAVINADKTLLNSRANVKNKARTSALVAPP